MAGPGQGGGGRLVAPELGPLRKLSASEAELGGWSQGPGARCMELGGRR